MADLFSAKILDLCIYGDINFGKLVCEDCVGGNVGFAFHFAPVPKTTPSTKKEKRTENKTTFMLEEQGGEKL